MIDAQNAVDPQSLFYIEKILRYYGFDTDKMSDQEWALTFWTLMDIRKRELGEG